MVLRGTHKRGTMVQMDGDGESCRDKEHRRGDVGRHWDVGLPKGGLCYDTRSLDFSTQARSSVGKVKCGANLSRGGVIGICAVGLVADEEQKSHASQ